MTTIYHNPRCSKSRATLALLNENHIQPNIIHYLETPPDAAQLEQILTLLAMKPRDLMRKNEPEYQELQLANNSLSDKALIQAMTEHPRLIERPIVVKDDKAVIGRPPENVLKIL